MEIIYLGHSAFQINTAKKTLLVDPFITGNPLAKHIDVDAIKADFLLLTHAHEDHTLDVKRIAKADTTIISNFEIVTYYQKKGIQGHALNFGGGFEFDFGYVKYVQALHSSSFADGTYGGNPGGFIIVADGKTIYISGDTALTLDMQLIANRYKLDLAILPIGDNYTMDVDDALRATDLLKCNRILGCHYDSFPAIVIDHEQSIEKFKQAGKVLILLEIGTSISI